jgi:hypothetical protein
VIESSEGLSFNLTITRGLWFLAEFLEDLFRRQPENAPIAPADNRAAEACMSQNGFPHGAANGLDMGCDIRSVV